MIRPQYIKQNSLILFTKIAMKSGGITTLFFFFFAFCVFSQQPAWEWAKGAGSLSSRGNAVCTDNNGNIIVCGSWSGNTLVVSNQTLTNPNVGNAELFFVCKYDVSGNLLWIKIPDYGPSTTKAVATDANGNIYVLGDFTGGITVNGTSLNSFANNGTDNVFLLKLNSSGNLVWARRAGGDYYANSSAIAIDSQGNAVICGRFNGSYLTLEQITVNNPDIANKSASLFLAKYDVSGNVIWAQSVKGNWGSDGNIPHGIACDQNNAIYMCGQCYSGTMVISTGTFNPVKYMFVSKFNAAGNLKWLKSFGTYSGDEINAITLDNNYNSYVTGQFTSNSLTIGPFTLINPHSNTFGENLFIAKLDSSGNVAWARSKDRAGGRAIGIYNNSDLIVSGFVRDSTNFNGTIVKGGSFFIAKYDQNGIENWGRGATVVKPVAWNNYVFSNSLVPKTNDYAYVTGFFQTKKIGFDSYTLSCTDSSGNYQSYFLAKISASFVGLPENDGISENSNLYPNPFSGTLIVEGTNGILEIFNLQGELILREKINGKTSIDFPGEIRPGIYFARIRNNQKCFCRMIQKF